MTTVLPGSTTRCPRRRFSASVIGVTLWLAGGKGYSLHVRIPDSSVHKKVAGKDPPISPRNATMAPFEQHVATRPCALQLISLASGVLAQAATNEQPFPGCCQLRWTITPLAPLTPRNCASTHCRSDGCCLQKWGNQN